tara:strand:+ start:664 stop:1086 length:423 start_codon:yes stop_codon:yes gene_type:complete
VSIIQQTFTAVSDSESTAVKISGSDVSGIKGAILGGYLKQTSGAGTQFALRWYLGWTASTTARFLTKLTIPEVAGAWGDGSDEDSIDSAPVKRFSTREADFGDGWTGGSPRAGLGLYLTAERLDDSGNCNLTTETETGRY